MQDPKSENNFQRVLEQIALLSSGFAELKSAVTEESKPGGKELKQLRQEFDANRAATQNQFETLDSKVETLSAATNHLRTNIADIDGKIVDILKSVKDVRTDVESKSKAEKIEIDELGKTLRKNDDNARAKASEFEGKMAVVSKTVTRVEKILEGKVGADDIGKLIWRNIRDNYLVISGIIGIIAFFATLAVWLYTSNVEKHLAKSGEFSDGISRDLKRAEEERGKVQMEIGQQIAAHTKAQENVDKSIEIIRGDLKKIEEGRSAFQLEISQRMTAQETRDNEKLNQLTEVARQLEALRNVIERQPQNHQTPELPIR